MKRTGFIAAIFLIVTLIGCSQVMMSPAYQAELEADARRVGELNERCQAGDELACREGLRVAAEALDLWVDAVHGIASEGGQR